MCTLSQYLLNTADRRIVLEEGVDEKSEFPLLLWRELEMTHERLKEMCQRDGIPFESIAPAAHLYPFGGQDLYNIYDNLTMLHCELSEVAEVNQGMWYIVKKNGCNSWYLYNNMDNLGDVPVPDGDVEVTSADTALQSLLYAFQSKMPLEYSLCKAMILPYGCNLEMVWKFSKAVVLLGEKELPLYRSLVVQNYMNGKEIIDIPILF